MFHVPPPGTLHSSWSCQVSWMLRLLRLRRARGLRISRLRRQERRRAAENASGRPYLYVCCV